MATVRNSFAQFMGNGALIAMGTIDVSDNTLDNMSGAPSGHDADITLTDDGTGDFTLTLNPFRGPKGSVVAFATTATISTFASVTGKTYTNDSLAVDINVENDASTATDADVDFLIVAW